MEKNLVQEIENAILLDSNGNFIADKNSKRVKVPHKNGAGQTTQIIWHNNKGEAVENKNVLAVKQTAEDGTQTTYHYDKSALSDEALDLLCQEKGAVAARKCAETLWTLRRKVENLLRNPQADLTDTILDGFAESVRSEAGAILAALNSEKQRRQNPGAGRAKKARPVFVPSF